MSDHSLTSALLVAYGLEPEIGTCLRALLDSTGVQLEIIVVDNGDRSGVLDQFEGCPRVRILRPGRNLGFAAACNLAAANASGEFLVLVNPDAIVAVDAIAHLVRALERAEVGIATASVRLASASDTINSVGNPVHYLGLAWAGGFGEPAAWHQTPTEVASASGACCAITANLWRELEGFDPLYFAYHEDVDLSLRCWQRGRSVVFVPDAVVVHHYEFARNELKTYLLERNRLITVLTTYSGKTLLELAIPLAVLEVVMICHAGLDGWLGAKLRGYGWLLTHVRPLARRRRHVQSVRTRSDHDLAHLYAITFTPANVTTGLGTALANRLSWVGGLAFRRWTS